MINITNNLTSFFDYLSNYLFVNLSLFFLYLFLRKYIKKKSWIDKVKYNRKEHLNLYVTRLFQQGSEIRTEKDFYNFCQDVVDSLHNLFVWKIPTNNIAWLIPECENFILL